MGVFVGRAEELAALAAAAGTAAAGNVAAVLIVGEPGSGKSRLLHEAASRARLEPQLDFVAYESEREVPLAAATRLLRELVLVPRYGPRLEALVFGEREGGDPVESLRIFEAAFRALRETQDKLSRSSPPHARRRARVPSKMQRCSSSGRWLRRRLWN